MSSTELEFLAPTITDVSSDTLIARVGLNITDVVILVLIWKTHRS